jgi:hypothetical protein
MEASIRENKMNSLKKRTEVEMDGPLGKAVHKPKTDVL